MPEDSAALLPFDDGSRLIRRQWRNGQWYFSVRAEVAERNLDLAGTAKDAGVITSRDFAIFQDYGYRRLYGGETARDIATRKGLTGRQHILDPHGLY